jgi:hypothetical protein
MMPGSIGVIESLDEAMPIGMTNGSSPSEATSGPTKHVVNGVSIT